MKIQYWLVLIAIGTQVGFTQNTKEKIIPLDSMFALTKQNSTQLKISKSQVDVALQTVKLTESQRLPSIDIGGTVSYLGNATVLDRNFSNAQSAAMPHLGTNFFAEASYVVFAGGALSQAIESAQIEARIAALAHDKNSMDIRLLIAGQYLDLYKLYNQKKVFHQTIEETNEQIKQVRARLATGTALNNDLTRHELQQQNLQLALIEIENSISIINKQLVTTVGLEAETTLIPDTLLQNIGNLPMLGDTMYEVSLANRPEMKIQTLKKELTQNQISQAKAKMYPSLVVLGANRMDGPITFEIPTINKNINYWFLGVGIKYNIASLYKTQKSISLAKTMANTASYAYEAEMENTRVLVYTARIKYNEALEKLSTYEKSFQLAQENYTVINKRYRNDLALITEMLDASNMKLKAELQLVNAKLDVVFNYYALKRATGTL